MPDPIIKIKRKTASAGAPTGLTVGEPAVNLFNNSFYVVNGSGTAITFGAEVDSNTSLGSSDNKIPTQKAVKTYVDNFNAGSAFQVEMAYNSDASSVNTGTNFLVGFNTTTVDTITGLNYAGGSFLNSSGSTMYLNVSYQIGFATNSSGYRATWIQTGGDPQQNKFGALYTTPNGATFHIHNGSSVIPLSNGRTFGVFAAHSAGVSINVGSNASDVARNKIDIFKFA
jgi:hypothetical protein